MFSTKQPSCPWGGSLCCLRGRTGPARPWPWAEARKPAPITSTGPYGPDWALWRVQTSHFACTPPPPPRLWLVSVASAGPWDPATAQTAPPQACTAPVAPLHGLGSSLGRPQGPATSRGPALTPGTSFRVTAGVRTPWRRALLADGRQRQPVADENPPACGLPHQ